LQPITYALGGVDRDGKEVRTFSRNGSRKKHRFTSIWHTTCIVGPVPKVLRTSIGKRYRRLAVHAGIATHPQSRALRRPA
jgi:hypothetical protein